MSRSNGPGAPPNGWPADYRPTEASDPYQDPYYTQQQRPAGPPPQQAPARGPRIQPAPAQSRVPQTGLPPNLAQGGPPQQNYAPSPYPGQQAPQGYGQPYTQPAPLQQPLQAAPQYAPPQHSQQYAPPQYAPQSPPQTYAQPQAYTPPQPQASAYAPQQPRTQPPAARQPAPQQPQHDPRFAPFGNFDAPPTARPTQPAAQPSQYPPAYTPAPSAYVPETTGRPTQPPQQQRAAAPYDQQWQQPAPQPGAPALNDPRGYDLGHYQPSVAPAAQDPRTQRPTAPPAWTPHAEPEARQHAPDPGFGAPLQADPHARNQALEPVHDDEYEDHEDDEDYEEAPRKTRYGLIAASLIAAIAAGGGLAYAYKMFVAPPTHTAAAPVIKSNTGPIKVKPVDPGGTKFANADSKMMENLSGSADTSSDGGPKQVKTMVIERDGSLASAQSASPPPQAARPASVGVPGMILANVPPPPAAQPAHQPAAVAAVVNPPVAQPQAPRPAPKIIAAAPAPAAYPDPVDAAPAAAPPAAPVKKVIPKKITPAAGPAPTTAPSAVGGPKGGNGFVAVLASVPASGSSRVEAMQQYADLQQKFGGVLGSKAPDVVEAKLPNGVYHRLIVGPPASRDAATSVCTQLKTAGYTADCWVTAF